MQAAGFRGTWMSSYQTSLTDDPSQIKYFSTLFNPEAFFQQHKQEIRGGNEWIPSHTNQLFLNDTYIMAHNLVTKKSTHTEQGPWVAWR